MYIEKKWVRIELNWVSQLKKLLGLDATEFADLLLVRSRMNTNEFVIGAFKWGPS